MSGNARPGVGLADELADAVGAWRDRAGGEIAGLVVEVRDTTPPMRRKIAAEVVRGHDLQVFVLAPEDLAATPTDRLGAVLALLDAAEVAGGAVLLPAADHLAGDRAGEVALADRLTTCSALVVLATDGLPPTSPLAAVVDHRLDD